MTRYMTQAPSASAHCSVVMHGHRSETGRNGGRQEVDECEEERTHSRKRPEFASHRHSRRQAARLLNLTAHLRIMDLNLSLVEHAMEVV